MKQMKLSSIMSIPLNVTEDHMSRIHSSLAKIGLGMETFEPSGGFLLTGETGA